MDKETLSELSRLEKQATSGEWGVKDLIAWNFGIFLLISVLVNAATIGKKTIRKDVVNWISNYCSENPRGILGQTQPASWELKCKDAP